MTTARYYGGDALREYLLSVYRGGFSRPLVEGREVAIHSFLSNEDLTACDTISLSDASTQSGQNLSLS